MRAVRNIFQLLNQFVKKITYYKYDFVGSKPDHNPSVYLLPAIDDAEFNWVELQNRVVTDGKGANYNNESIVSFVFFLEPDRFKAVTSNCCTQFANNNLKINNVKKNSLKIRHRSIS